MSVWPFQHFWHASGDRVNPIILREVRRMVRSRVFFGTFCLMHLAMVGLVVAVLGEPPGSPFARVILGWFWTVLGGYLTVYLPLSSLTSVSSEYAEGRIDLLLLSGLSGRQIVVGKWAVVMVQALLVLVSLLPYFALRYFIGSISVGSELLGLVWLLAASALASALAVQLSSVRGMGKRILAGLGWFFLGVPAAFFGGGFLIAAIANSSAAIAMVFGFLYLGLLTFGLLVLAGKIAGGEPLPYTYQHYYAKYAPRGSYTYRGLIRRYDGEESPEQSAPTSPFRPSSEQAPPSLPSP